MAAWTVALFNSQLSERGYCAWGFGLYEKLDHCVSPSTFHSLKACLKLSSSSIFVVAALPPPSVPACELQLSPSISLSLSCSLSLGMWPSSRLVGTVVMLSSWKPPKSLRRKQQKNTLEQPQNVDTNPCICQADLDLLKTALSLTTENCHHTTSCFLRDREADGSDTVKCSSRPRVVPRVLEYLLEDPGQG